VRGTGSEFYSLVGIGTWGQIFAFCYHSFSFSTNRNCIPGFH